VKTDENVEKVRILVRTGHHLDMRVITEQLNVDTERVGPILTTNLNMEKVGEKACLF
jgi:hypothetical protein